jgi:hypothetical protein
MLADERDAAREIRVRQARHGDQEMIGERIGVFHDGQYPAVAARTQDYSIYDFLPQRREERKDFSGFCSSELFFALFAPLRQIIL